MNLNSILRLLLRPLLNKLINKGMNAAFDKRDVSNDTTQQPQKNAANHNVQRKRMSQSMRMLRRLTRF